MNRISRKFILFLCVLVFILDVSSKYYVHYHIPIMNGGSLWYPYRGIGVFQNFLGIEFSISHAINKGAAWGIFADYQRPLLFLRIGLILSLLLYLLCFNPFRSKELPLALIFTGAFSNILDYFFYGHVVDMLHFVLWGYDFPVFNVADSAIFIGISWLIVQGWLEQRPLKTSSIC